MKTYVETWMQCPRCGLNMIYFKRHEKGMQFMECNYKECVGFGRRYAAKMLEVELTEIPRESDGLRQNPCRIYGSNVSFEKIVDVKHIQSVCQDIWDHPHKYAAYRKSSDDYFDKFLQFLWVSFPDGTEKLLADIVQA